MQNSRFTDEFQTQRPTTNNQLKKYLCHHRHQNEISEEEYKEYVEQQMDQIREINVNAIRFEVSKIITKHLSLLNIYLIYSLSVELFANKVARKKLL